MIRAASVDDIAEIARLGAQFHVEAGWADIADYDEGDCREFLTELLGNEYGILLVVDDGGIVGMAGGLSMPLYFNRDHRHGQELFFWVHPEHRGKHGSALLDAFEAAGFDTGCASWAMVALDKVRPELTGRLYRRRGYRAAEHTWIKRF